MKFNRRILISSIVLFSLSTASVASATYAWFTVNKTASMSIGATFDTDADIDIGLLKSGGFDAVDYRATSDSKIVLSNRSLTDVSGQGTTFYKPIFASNNVDFSCIEVIDFKNEASKSDNFYFVTAALKFRSNEEYRVYIGETNHEGVISGALAPCVKIAFFDGGSYSANPEVLPDGNQLKQIIYDGDADDYYLDSTSAKSIHTENEGVISKGYGRYSDLSTGNVDDAPIYRSDVVKKYTSDEAALSDGFNTLTTLTDSGTTYNVVEDGMVKTYQLYEAYVIVVIWIEGVDPQCTTAISNGSLNLKLGFQFMNNIK